MQETFTADDFAGTKTGNSLTFTPEDFSQAQFTQADFASQAAPVQPGDINPAANRVPDLQVTTRGGPPLSLPDAKTAVASFVGELNDNALSEVLPYVSNIARSLPADIAAGLSVFKRPQGQQPTLLPSPSAISGAVTQNLPAAAESSGNIKAAILNEPMPIDAILSEASKDSQNAAVLAKVSQGLAATAPLAAIGVLPAAVQKLALVGFTAKMMSEAPHIATELGNELGKPKEQQDPDKVSTLVSDAIQTIGFSTLGATHLIRSGAKVVSDYAENITPRGQGIASPELKALAPQTAAAVEQSTTGVPNASSQQIATPPDGGVRTRSELGQLPEGNVEEANARLRINEGEIPSTAQEKVSDTPATEAALKETQAVVQPENVTASDVALPSSAKPSEAVTAPEQIKTTPAPPVKPDVDRLYKSEHEDLLRLQREYEDALVNDLGKAGEIRTERDDLIQRLGEFDRLFKKDDGITFDDSPDVALAKAIRQDPASGIAAASLEAARQRRQDIENRIYDDEPIPDAAKKEFPDLFQPKPSIPAPIRKPRKAIQQPSPNLGGSIESKSAAEQEAMGVEVPKLNKVEPTTPEKPSEIKPSEAKVEPGQGGVPYYRKLGEQDALDPSRKRKRAVPQNFKLAYLDGWYAAKKSGKISEGPGAASPGDVPQKAQGGESVAGAIATPGPPLAPAAAGSVSLPPKSQRQIITDIAKGLKLPVRFGRLTTTKFAGYFKSVANLIGSKRADDIPIVSHEAGHKLDKTFSLSSDASLKPELDILGDPATPGSRSSWTKSKTKKYKMGEGVAEFVRYWLTDPAHAQRVAPNTFAAFERALDSNKDFGDTVRQAQDDIAIWRNSDPQARLRSQISIGDNPNKTRYTASQLTRDLVDDLHILKLATLDAAPKGTKLDPSADPYVLARNLRGSYGMADTFIRNGVVDFKTKAVQLGTSLEDALKPVAGRLNDFRDWIVAKRAQELRSQGRESGLVPSDVDAVAAKFDSDQAFQQAFTAVKNWNDALLQYAVDADLIQKGSPRTPTHSPTGSYAIREMNQDYVPFHRVFEIGAGESPSQAPQGIGMGLSVGKPGSLKSLHGSTRQIVDPLETMVKNAYTIITASEKAAINTAVADLSKLPDMGKWVERIATPKEHVPVELERIRKQLEDAGADLTAVPDDLLMSFFRQSRSAPFGENIIRVVRNGKAEFYRLNRDLHDTFQALDLEDTGKLVRILSSPAQVLRAGVVLEPSFSIANVLRDTFSASVIGKYGALPFETTLKGMAAMVKDPKLVAEWAASGGKSAVEASYFDRAKLQKFLAERISKDLTPAERALIVTRSPLSALRWLSSTFEEATRVGEYKIAYEQLRKSGMPEGEARRQAAFEARDRQDFAKGGAKTKIIRHMAAFWNAGLQANVKLAQAFKERPVRTTLQGLAFITIPKLIEQAINWDDDDYWARKQWERDMFFLIPIGKGKDGHTQFLRIPTPFEVGVIFGTFPGRILQSLREKHPDAMKSFPSLMLKQSVPNPIPQGMQVVFEDFLSGKKGWDVWRGRTIVPESLADEPPEMQWTEQTSSVAKKAGEMLKFSPMKIDHLIERTAGGMGKLVTGRSVPGQRFVTAPLTVSNQATETFYDRLESLREDAARAKAARKAIPAEYAAFQATERRLAELRKLSRETKDLNRKAALQEQALKLTTEILKRYPDKK